MALASTIVWELRTTGNANNGGGFNSASSGTDYSQQDSAQLTKNDLTTDVAGTTLSSGSGGFTAAMVGNIINITAGTGFTVGRYEIKTFVSANSVTIDRSAGASASGGTGYVGGGVASWATVAVLGIIAGHIVYVKSGTYTLSANFQTTFAGSATAPVKFIGYNTSRSTTPTGDDRPLINCGASYYWWTNESTYVIVKNLRFTGTAAFVFILGSRYITASSFTWAQNCKATNTSGTAGRDAISLYGLNCGILDCEGQSTNGYAANVWINNAGGYPGYAWIVGCYLHDSSHGLGLGNFCDVLFNVIDTCGNGLSYTNSGFYIVRNTIVNNTIYNCTNGINFSLQPYDNTFINNIIATCTTGARFTTASTFNLWINNNWSGNTTDTVNVTKGDTDLALDPQFVDAANGNFNIGTNLRGKGFPTTFPGSSTYSAIDIGACQSREIGKFTPWAGG